MKVEAQIQPEDQEQYRDKIATVDQQGKRVWMYPKKPKGRFYNMRSILSYLLLVVLFGMPFIHINGDPFLLFNVLERRFILFGISFMPQDFHLFVIAMLTLVVFIVLFTVVYGRLFCGWVCPQTIFMEMVFRKIEYWIEGDANAQKRLNKAPWTANKIFKKASKQAIFFALSVVVANTFLAYIIGVKEVFRIISEPISANLGGFITMIIFSGVFYFVFSYMREQVCIAICPYGRLQGVLLDKNSIVVAYDHVRGEPRGKIKRTRKAKNPVRSIQHAVVEASAAEAVCTSPTVAVGGPEAIKRSLGDCIDCKLCIKVCPTGIDIRDGTQLECINCTACMDACDEVMDKVGRDRGLIRYDSQTGIEESRNRIFTPRVIAYSIVLGILIIANIVLLNNRSEVEAVILRTPGMLYQKVDETTISNLYNYQIFNKTKASFPIQFRIKGNIGSVRAVGAIKNTEPEKMTEGAFFIDVSKDQLNSRKTKLTIEVYSGDQVIDQVSTTFLGPVK